MNAYCPAPGIGPDSPSDNDYRPGFSAELMLKDLRLSQQAADSADAATRASERELRIRRQTEEDEARERKRKKREREQRALVAQILEGLREGVQRPIYHIFAVRG